MNGGNGQLAVPPGFRFHPTDEELLYYYLRKKVAYEAIDLDVIRDVDLNKLEPWDLNDKCRIGSGPQNEWYFFSHKDRKYPTGTRTNRATSAGFWKATGRDKAIHLNNSRRIGMRKTLVFYTGRAPHGQKTDWIMHEYRLEDDTPPTDHFQEEGWVVCRVFKKKNFYKCSNIPSSSNQIQLPQETNPNQFKHLLYSSSIYHSQTNPLFNFVPFNNDNNNMMHLPQLLSSDQSSVDTTFISQPSITPLDIECSHNLMKLNSSCNEVGRDWSILDKLLVSGHHNQLDQFLNVKCGSSTINSQNLMEIGTSAQILFPLQYLGCDADLMKFSKEG